MPAENRQTIVVENINTPGRTTKVDAEKYSAMRSALMKVLPAKSPGLSQTEMRSAVLAHLPEHLFPGGTKAVWWVKCAQLDLEAKGTIVRETTAKPLRWHRVAGNQAGLSGRSPDDEEAPRGGKASSGMAVHQTCWHTAMLGVNAT